LKTLILDNFLTHHECNSIIRFYKENEENVFNYRDVFPLNCNAINIKLSSLTAKLFEVSKLFESQIDWFQIVRWPKNSFQELHFDSASKETTLSSIVYLNDNFKGGQTFFEDGTIFQPVKGRGLFFDGQYHKHGVKKIEDVDRFVVATWYKKL